MKRVQGTHLESDTLPCLIVESSSGRKEESVRKKDISLSAETESLKGSRKEQTVGKSVKERKTLKGLLKRIFIRFSNCKVVKKDRSV